jgi:hypothetical protein
MIYLLIAFGAIWGILTLINLREEDKDIQQMLESARWIKSIEDKNKSIHDR